MITNNRTKLLCTFTSHRYSQSAKHETMLLFKDVDPNKKEDLAKMLIPIVENSESEEEALQNIRETIQNYLTT